MQVAFSFPAHVGRGALIARIHRLSSSLHFQGGPVLSGATLA